MRCQVIKPFNRRGEIQHPGSIIDVPKEMLLNMAGYVQPVATADTYQKPKAWLVNGELRTSGDVDDLASEIVMLTADNLPEQKSLLLLHCEAYDKHHFPALAELWAERAAIMEYDCGLMREEAEERAAVLLNCLAFLPELRCKAM